MLLLPKRVISPRMRVHIHRHIVTAGRHIEHVAVVTFAAAELLHMHSVLYSLYFALGGSACITWAEETLKRRNQWKRVHRQEWLRSRRDKPTRGGLA